VPLAGLAAPGADRIELTLATRATVAGRELLVGTGLRLRGPAGVAADATATLVAIPLTGAGTVTGTGSAGSAGSAGPRALPSAAVTVEAPGDPAVTLVDAAGLRVGHARAGLRWGGSTLRPVVELVGVAFEGRTYELIDLSNADSVRAAAADAVRAAIADALGPDGPGGHLAVRAGPARRPPTHPAPDHTSAPLSSAAPGGGTARRSSIRIDDVREDRTWLDEEQYWPRCWR